MICARCDFPLREGNTVGLCRRCLIAESAARTEEDREPATTWTFPLEDGPTAIYRLYAADRELLYVGMSNDPFGRLAVHRRWFPWMRAVVAVTIEWFPGRAEAIREEIRAITEENPPYNRRIG